MLSMLCLLHMRQTPRNMFSMKEKMTFQIFRIHRIQKFILLMKRKIQMSCGHHVVAVRSFSSMCLGKHPDSTLSLRLFFVLQGYKVAYIVFKKENSVKKAKSWSYASPLVLKSEDRTTGMKSKSIFFIEY